MRLSDKDFAKLWKIRPMASSDSVVIHNNEILLVKRATKPFKGFWTLPGGIMDPGETIEQTAVREVLEEPGAKVTIDRMLGVYSGPKRDPRGTSLSVVFLMKFIKFVGVADKEVSEVKFFPVNKIPSKLGFDHKTVINDALKLSRKDKCN